MKHWTIYDFFLRPCNFFFNSSTSIRKFRSIKEFYNKSSNMLIISNTQVILGIQNNHYFVIINIFFYFLSGNKKNNKTN